MGRSMILVLILMIASSAVLCNGDEDTKSNISKELDRILVILSRLLKIFQGKLLPTATPAEIPEAPSVSPSLPPKPPANKTLIPGSMPLVPPSPTTSSSSEVETVITKIPSTLAPTTSININEVTTKPVKTVNTTQNTPPKEEIDANGISEITETPKSTATVAAKSNNESYDSNIENTANAENGEGTSMDEKLNGGQSSGSESNVTPDSELVIITEEHSLNNDSLEPKSILFPPSEFAEDSIEVASSFEEELSSGSGEMMDAGRKENVKDDGNTLMKIKMDDTIKFRMHGDNNETYKSNDINFMTNEIDDIESEWEKERTNNYETVTENPKLVGDSELKEIIKDDSLRNKDFYEKNGDWKNVDIEKIDDSVNTTSYAHPENNGNGNISLDNYHDVNEDDYPRNVSDSNHDIIMDHDHESGVEEVDSDEKDDLLDTSSDEDDIDFLKIKKMEDISDYTENDEDKEKSISKHQEGGVSVIESPQLDTGVDGHKIEEKNEEGNKETHDEENDTYSSQMESKEYDDEVEENEKDSIDEDNDSGSSEREISNSEPELVGNYDERHEEVDSEQIKSSEKENKEEDESEQVESNDNDSDGVIDAANDDDDDEDNGDDDDHEDDIDASEKKGSKETKESEDSVVDEIIENESDEGDNKSHDDDDDLLEGTNKGDNDKKQGKNEEDSFIESEENGGNSDSKHDDQENSHVSQDEEYSDEKNDDDEYEYDEDGNIEDNTSSEESSRENESHHKKDNDNDNYEDFEDESAESKTHESEESENEDADSTDQESELETTESDNDDLEDEKTDSKGQESELETTESDNDDLEDEKTDSKGQESEEESTKSDNEDLDDDPADSKTSGSDEESSKAAKHKNKSKSKKHKKSRERRSTHQEEKYKSLCSTNGGTLANSNKNATKVCRRLQSILKDIDEIVNGISKDSSYSEDRLSTIKETADSLDDIAKEIENDPDSIMMNFNESIVAATINDLNTNIKLTKLFTLDEEDVNSAMIGSSHIFIIVIASVAAIIVLLFFILCCYCCYKKQKLCQKKRLATIEVAAQTEALKTLSHIGTYNPYFSRENTLPLRVDYPYRWDEALRNGRGIPRPRSIIGTHEVNGRRHFSDTNTLPRDRRSLENVRGAFDSEYSKDRNSYSDENEGGPDPKWKDYKENSRQTKNGRNSESTTVHLPSQDI